MTSNYALMVRTLICKVIVMQTRDTNDKRLTIRYVFFIEIGAISWNYKKQSIIARSMIEAKYMAANHCTIEACWIKKLLEDIRLVQLESTLIMCDKQGCLVFVKNPKHHLKTKYIDVQYHFIIEKIDDGIIDMTYCAINDMLVDMLTKAFVNDRPPQLI